MCRLAIALLIVASPLLLSGCNDTPDSETLLAHIDRLALTNQLIAIAVSGTIALLLGLLVGLMVAHQPLPAEPLSPHSHPRSPDLQPASASAGSGTHLPFEHQPHHRPMSVDGGNSSAPSKLGSGASVSALDQADGS